MTWFNAKHYTPGVVASLFDQALARIDTVEPDGDRERTRSDLQQAKALCVVISNIWGYQRIIDMIPVAESITGPDWVGKPTAPDARQD